MNPNLGLILLNNVLDVNNFQPTLSLTINSGNSGTLYFRLVNQNQALGGGFFERYIATSPTLTVNFNNNNLANNLSLPATQPFAGDASIFSVAILPSYNIASLGLTATVTFGGNTYNVPILSKLLVQATGNPSGTFYC
jgi:hypothetical protein